METQHKCLRKGNEHFIWLALILKKILQLAFEDVERGFMVDFLLLFGYKSNLC